MCRGKRKWKRLPVFGFMIGWCLVIHLYGLEEIRFKDSTKIDLALGFRGFALNDQRIYWSGVEFGFGAEAVIRGEIEKQFDWGKIRVENEFFLNQPFGKNILTDEGRQKYLANYSLDPFAISKLNLQVRFKHLSVAIGKARTPFGRAGFPVFSNDFNFGSPFIRSEAILWRETGIFIHYRKGILSFDLAAVNGEKDRDTNSGKAGIFRLGLEGKRWGLGFSYKVHDGIGSEWQKIYKDHAGVDFRLEFSSSLILSGEVIYDQYGFHRPFDDNGINWPTSIYYRDIFHEYKTPISGVGGYVNLLYRSPKWIVNLNYGEYYPEEIDNIYHDTPNKRGIVKIAYRFAKGFRMFLVGLLENQRPRESWRSGAKPFAGLAGFEYTL